MLKNDDDNQAPRTVPEIAVFAYNRPALLLNLARSIELFAPRHRVTVWDDGSTDPVQILVLDLLAKKFGWSVRSQEGGIWSKHGGLYGNMNRAVDEYEARGVRRVLFLQDDMQLLWPLEDVMTEVDRLFALQDDVVQVSATFHRSLQGSARVPWYEANCYLLPEMALADTGLIDLQRFDRMGLCFGPTEQAAARNAKVAGAKALGLRVPFVAFVPWPESFRFRRSRSTVRSSPRPLYLKPLEDTELKSWRGLPLSRYPTHEELCRPWGWKALAPFVYQGGAVAWLPSVVHATLKRRPIGGICWKTAE